MSAHHRIYIVRHGNTFDKGDVVTRVGGRTDLPLSTSGIAQADALAAYFARADVQFDAVYSSPLKRTMETARRIVEGQSRTLSIERTDFLREIDYGPDENRPEAEVLARIGEDALDLWEADAVVPDGWCVDPDGLVSSWTAFLAELALSDPPGASLIVTSNGIARFALKALGDGVADAHTLKLATGAFGVLETADARTYTVLDWNTRP